MRRSKVLQGRGLLDPVGGSRARGVLFELFRRSIPQCRVQPLVVVVMGDELFQVFGKLLEIPVLVAVDFLLLQSLHEAFTSRIGEGRQLRVIKTLAIPTSRSSTLIIL